MGYPVDIHSRPVLIYRWIVFLLAAGFVVRQLVVTGDYSDPGGPFRFLTIWALLLSFFCASRMLALTERRSERDWSTTVALTAVANALVVAMYWRLWLQDPALVTAGEPLPFWVDIYLHGLGPALQWIDALFIHGAFRRVHRVMAPYGGLVGAYVLWIEGVVGPAGHFPVGRVTEGLPYPFLNDLTSPERMRFYATTAFAGIVFLGLFAGVSWGLRRWRQPPSALKSDSSPSR